MRILIEVPTWLGDAIMSTPAIENLMNFHKGSEVTLVGSLLSLEVFRNHPNVSEFQVLSKKHFSLFNEAKKLGKFDLFFSFRNSFRSTFFKLCISSKYKYQYKKNDVKKYHQVEKYNNFINKSLNTQYFPGRLTIYTDVSLREDINPGQKKRPLLGINPGASYGNAKRWYPNEFADVAAKLSSQFDIVILGGINEKKIAMDIQALLLKKGVNNYQNLAGSFNVAELIQYISTLDLLITGDSGPMHIAASFQIPSITIFGPTRENETSQWMNPKSIVVKKSLDCQPCMKRVCPLKHHNCMRLIKSNDVIEAVNSLNLI